MNELVTSGTEPEGYQCENPLCTLTSFDSVGSLPILVNPVCPYSLDLSSRLFEDYVLVSRSDSHPKLLTILKRIVQGNNKISFNNFQELMSLLPKGASVLIIGGGTRGSGTQQVYENSTKSIIKLYSIDVYPSAEIDCIADAHCLPFPDSFFDCVIIQAVLEHVVSPNQVLSEIYRVTSDYSFVYSEVPFIQSVHEGPFDFTRFTHSGHQLLFSSFHIISTGVHHGPTQSVLFVLSHYSQLLFGKLSRIVLYSLFARFSRFIDDRLFSNSRLIDMACGTYVLAQKRSDCSARELTVQFIKSLYLGRQ